MPLSHNNWLDSNIRERITNPDVDFRLKCKLYPFKLMSFDEAITYNISVLPKKKLFVAFSGGVDSEVIVRALHKHGVDFTIVIVYAVVNSIEFLHAIEVCKELKIEPVVLRISEKQFVQTYYNEIFKKFKGVGTFSVSPYLVAKYAAEHDGVAIGGEHLMDAAPHVGQLFLYEHDAFYNDVLVPNVSLSFFNYTLELVAAMAAHTPLDFDITKYAFYGLKNPRKIVYKLSKPSVQLIHSCHSKITAKPYSRLMSRQELVDKAEHASS